MNWFRLKLLSESLMAGGTVFGGLGSEISIYLHNTGLSWEFDPRQKMRWNIPTKVRPILNTYGQVKSRGSIKSWGPSAYFGDFGP